MNVYKLYIEDETFKLFDNFFKKKDTLELFALLYKNHFSVNATSKGYFKHRNTITYWIQKFKTTTELDILHDFEVQLLVYLYLVKRGYIDVEKFDLT